MLKKKLSPALDVIEWLSETHHHIKCFEIFERYVDVVIDEYIISADALVKIAAMVDYKLISEAREGINYIILRIHYEKSELSI